MNDKLSALEWSVVALARGDRLSSLQAPGKFSTFLKRLFEGERPSPAFADKRLEALRRVSVLASFPAASYRMAVHLRIKLD